MVRYLANSTGGALAKPPFQLRLQLTNVICGIPAGSPYNVFLRPEARRVEYAVCSICNFRASTPERSTSGLTGHLEHHLRAFIHGPAEEARDILYAKLAALRGLSFRILASPEMVEFGCTYHPLRSPNGVKGRVLQVHKEVSSALKEGLQLVAAQGAKFGLMTDEWEACNHDRYCGLYLVSSIPVPPLNQRNVFLGLLRIKTSATARNLLGLIETRLSAFQVDWTNVVAFISDGAATMVALGRLIANKCGSHFVAVKCTTHTLHLAFRGATKRAASLQAGQKTVSAASLSVSPTSSTSTTSNAFSESMFSPAASEVAAQQAIAEPEDRDGSFTVDSFDLGEPAPVDLISYNVIITKVRSRNHV